ncbi:hypothetical protein SBD_6687 [Streptomyces bottropensis ATCC 25435]|uniref:Uncharacterized protein n=1 Tax=Streptomyces bottropensis ATCC 25435 TaxID=1054862 RepID=M3FGY3_9ACTN|nr:hypothetical protein SBD_6687 [Streptomyces bottropensis ATCC 25435]
MSGRGGARFFICGTRFFIFRTADGHATAGTALRRGPKLLRAHGHPRTGRRLDERLTERTGS